MTEAYLCPNNHVIPATSQFADRDNSEKLIDAFGMPMYEWGYRCSCCEKVYGLSRLTEVDLPERDASVIHDSQLTDYIINNPIG